MAAKVTVPTSDADVGSLAADLCVNARAAMHRDLGCGSAQEDLSPDAAKMQGAATYNIRWQQCMALGEGEVSSNPEGARVLWVLEAWDSQ